MAEAQSKKEWTPPRIEALGQISGLVDSGGMKIADTLGASMVLGMA